VAYLEHAEGADKALADLISKYELAAPYQVVEVYGSRGETNKAFQWLDRAYSLR
jgi:hypothetical protein